MKGHVLHLFLWQRKAPGTGGGGACLRCLALTSMSDRFLQRRYDLRGGEENAFRHRCEEWRMLRLLEMTWGIFGKPELNVITNGILRDSFWMEVSSALLRGIWLTLSIASLKVFMSSLYKVCCECTWACIEELVCWTSSAQSWGHAEANGLFSVGWVAGWFKEVLMLVCGFDIKVSFQSAVNEYYFYIKERDLVVGKGAGKFNIRM